MSLVNTLMVNLREQSAGFYQWIDMPAQYGATAYAMLDTESPNSLVSPGLKEKAWASIGRTVQIPVYDSGSVSISASRSATISDSELTSQLYDCTFVTASWGFTINPALYVNNEMTPEIDFNQKYIRYLNQFHTDLETAILAKLTTNKTQIFGLDPVDLGYTNVGSVVTSAYADREKIIGDLDALQFGNKVYGNQNIIANGGVMSIFNQMKEKAEYNEVNRTYQFRNKNFFWSNVLTNDSGMMATMFSMPSGTSAILFRAEREGLLQTPNMIGYAWEPTTLLQSGIPVIMYSYQSAGDFNALGSTATADNTRSIKFHVGFSVDYCILTPYNTALGTYRNPIIKAQVAKA